MSFSDISPKYMMELIGKVEDAIWALSEKSKYQYVEGYIQRWWTGEGDEWGNLCNENFTMYYKDSKIDLTKTLRNMPNDTIIRIATDLGIDTPGFLPIVPEKFKNILKDQNQNAYQNFERAIKNVYSEPDLSVALSSTTLEGIIRTILEHESFKGAQISTGGNSLEKQIKLIVRRFSALSGIECPNEITTIASQLRGIGCSIDNLRSDKSTSHGKINGEYVVDNPLWASLIVNTIASLGLFLWEFFNEKYKLAVGLNEEFEGPSLDEAISLDELPF